MGAFQSAPLLRGATALADATSAGITVSIRAPRMGSAIGKIRDAQQKDVSIRAPRMRSATEIDSWDRPRIVSIRAPRMRSATVVWNAFRRRGRRECSANQTVFGTKGFTFSRLGMSKNGSRKPSGWHEPSADFNTAWGSRSNWRTTLLTTKKLPSESQTYQRR